jgi:hypothetical protein
MRRDVALRALLGVGVHPVADPLDDAGNAALAVGIFLDRFVVDDEQLEKRADIRTVPIAIHIGFGNGDRAARVSAR